MKTVNYFLILFIVGQSYGQDQSVAMKNEFSTISKFPTRQNGFESIQTYSSGETKGSQFFLKKWSTGYVTTMNNEKISNNYLFLFDKVRQELFLKEKDKSEVFLADKKSLKGFSLNGEHTLKFISSALFKEDKFNGFYQVLVEDVNKYTLLKKVTAKFIRADKTDMVKMRSGEFNDEFKDEIQYLISYKNETPKEIKMREKKIISIINASDKPIAEKYFAEHPGNLDEEYLSEFIRSLNLN